ncbi:MAG: hypothetical protein NTU88_09940, partial [Armatimonadetes bacterium]|nr:hypothetical protein [Armatimonadota bacterium]
ATTDSHGDTCPAVGFTADDEPIVLWLQRDYGVPEDDDDLYYKLIEIAAGIPYRTPGYAPLLSAGTGFSGFGVGPCWTADFDTEKIRIPVISKTFKVTASGEICFLFERCGLTGGGEVGVSTSLGDIADVAVKSAAEARLTASTECEYVLDYLRIGPRIEGVFHFPWYKTPPIPYLSLDAGLRVVLSGGGDMVWKGTNFQWWPPCESTIEFSLGGGPYGRAKWWSRYAEVYGEVTGTCTYTMPPNSWRFDGVTVRLCFDTNRHSIRNKGGCLQFGPFFGPPEGGSSAWLAQTPTRVQTTSVSPQRDVTSIVFSDDGVLGTYEEIDTIHILMGTGAVYEGTPVLDDISNDLKDDGPPSVARSSAGELLLAWTKDSSDPNSNMGSSAVVSQYDGNGWGPPIQMDSSANFNSYASVAFDSRDVPFAIWASAPANVTIDSTLAEIDAAMSATDIVFSHRAGGTWSTPAKIAELPGTDSETSIAADGSGQLLAAWVNDQGSVRNIVASTYQDGTWSSAAVLSTGGIVGSPTTGFVAGQPAVIWSQDGDGDPATTADGVLYQCVFTSGAWSSPTRILAPPAPGVPVAKTSGIDPVSQNGQERFSADGSPAGGQPTNLVALSPPPECCKKKKKPSPDPPTDPLGGTTTRGVFAIEPNEKVGPPGVRVERFVSSDDELTYIIYSENDPKATASAQEVFITDYLDTDLDWSTFRLMDVAFGPYMVTSLAGQFSGTARVPLESSSQSRACRKALSSPTKQASYSTLRSRSSQTSGSILSPLRRPARRRASVLPAWTSARSWSARRALPSR